MIVLAGPPVGALVICHTSIRTQYIPLIAGTVRTVLVHQICTFLVAVNSPKAVRNARRKLCHAIQWTVPLDRIFNVLGRRRLQGLRIAVLYSRDGRNLKTIVSCQQCCIVWTFVVVGNTADGWVEAIDGIWAWQVLLLKMRTAMGLLAVPSDDVQWLVAVVTRITCRQRARPATMAGFAFR